MYPPHWEKKPENKHWWPQAFQIGPLNLQHMKAQTYCNTASTISQAWSSGWLLLNAILCLMVSTCKRTILLLKKKNQLSPAIHLLSSWKIWVKHSASQSKQGTKGVRGIHHCRLRFSLFTPNVFSRQVQMTLSLRAAGLFLPTLASKEAARV